MGGIRLARPGRGLAARHEVGTHRPWAKVVAARSPDDLGARLDENGAQGWELVKVESIDRKGRFGGKQNDEFVLGFERTLREDSHRTTCPLWGATRHLARAFVLLSDSDDLHSMEAATGALTLQLTPLQEPCLAEDSLQMWTAGRLSGGVHGYIHQADPAEPGAIALLLRDSDADGVIDSTTEVPAGQWGALVDPLVWAERYDS